jgi:hypothetical protein
MPLDVFILIALAGILATYAHLVVALWAPRFGLPRIDFSAGIAELTWGETFDGNAPYWMGFAAIHMNGIVFALLYANVSTAEQKGAKGRRKNGPLGVCSLSP